MSSVHSYPLISIRSDATVQDAARLMDDCTIGAVGVLGEKKEFVGILTERDVTGFVARGKHPCETEVCELVNHSPVVVEGPIDEVEALERMRSARIRHLIVHEGGDFRIVSMRDFVFTMFRRDGGGDHYVRDVMTAPAVACLEDAYFEEVAEALAELGISGMPVVDREIRVVGVISERDLAHAMGGAMVRLALPRPAQPEVDDLQEIPRWARRAKDVMSRPPLTILPDASLEQAARLMRVHKVNRLPVVKEGRLLGVVSRGDLLSVVAHAASREVDLTQLPILVGTPHDDLAGVMA